MATTGVKYATTAATSFETPWDDEDWVSSSSATGSPNSSGAACPINTSGQKSYVLKVNGYDFSALPSNATIIGVSVTLRASYVSGTLDIDLVQLLDTAGGKAGTNNASTPVALNSSFTDHSFGGSTDLWGNALTAAWVKDADFGVAVGVAATSNSSSASVDSVGIEVHYTVPSTYYVVYLASATDPADDSTGYAQIIAGQDGSGAAGAASGSIVAPTADATDSALATITGLDASTEYVAAAVWWDGASDYGDGRVLSAGITTSSAGGFQAAWARGSNSIIGAGPP